MHYYCTNYKFQKFSSVSSKQITVFTVFYEKLLAIRILINKNTAKVQPMLHFNWLKLIGPSAFIHVHKLWLHKKLSMYNYELWTMYNKI